MTIKRQRNPIVILPLLVSAGEISIDDQKVGCAILQQYAF